MISVLGILEGHYVERVLSLESSEARDHLIDLAAAWPRVVDAVLELRPEWRDEIREAIGKKPEAA